MKKILLLTAMLMAVTQLWAVSISQTAAQSKAQAFLRSQASGKIMAPKGNMDLRLVGTGNHFTHEPAYYVFNAADAFVIVAGDDRARQILAYGDRPINMNDIPENMQYWLSCYETQIAFLMDDADLYDKICNCIGMRVASKSTSPALYMVFREEDGRYVFYASENLGVRLAVG